MHRLFLICAGIALCGGMSVSALAQSKITIGQLLKDNWKIAGYTAPGDNRSSFILFQHPDHHYLVNCRIGYDVTREPRSFVNCYELR